MALAAASARWYRRGCYNVLCILLLFFYIVATIAYIFCYPFSGEVSGDVTSVSDEISFDTLADYFCYNSVTFLLRGL
jgi:hypothetical protein